MTSLPIPINRKEESTPTSSPGKSPSPRWEVRAVRTPTGRRKHFYVDHERRATYWNMPKEQEKQEPDSYSSPPSEETSQPNFPPPPQYYAEETEQSYTAF
ncbi:hypothetical protein Gasu2_69980 [Galdieria sulphuraria]|nr:hypothetical protein Gasu2_69980 [Galdieria sulphuraria]